MPRILRSPFRSYPISGHRQSRSACLKSANTGLAHRGIHELFDYVISASQELVGTSCHPQTVRCTVRY